MGDGHGPFHRLRPSGSGFREYFDPMDGTGRGSARFSWSAALFTDMVLSSRRPRDLAKKG